MRKYFVLVSGIVLIAALGFAVDTRPRTVPQAPRESNVGGDFRPRPGSKARLRKSSCGLNCRAASPRFSSQEGQMVESGAALVQLDDEQLRQEGSRWQRRRSNSPRPN